MNEEVKLPFYLKSTLILLGLMLLGYLIFLGAEILVPLGFAFLLSILFHPLVQWLERKRIPRGLAILIAIILGFLIVGSVVFFLVTQFASFSEALPQLKDKLHELLFNFQNWLSSKFGISSAKQAQWVKQSLSGGSQVLGSTVSAFTGALVVILIVPVYVFLLLFYRPLLVNFISEVFAGKNDKRTIREILRETKQVVQSYMVGLLIETSIVATLNTIALLIIGIDYAIVLGIIGGLLNMIPYIGGLIAISLPVLMALVTEDSLTPIIWIIGAYIFIQFLDNNVLVPRIVASKVRINAMISILAVLLGGALAGTAGMFLSLPVVAIIKIIFDRVESLKPWGKLLGDEMPGENKPNLNDEKQTVAQDDKT